MNNKYLIIGMLILTVLGLGCIDEINKSISNISSNISGNISDKINKSISNISSNVSGKIEKIGKEKIENVEQKIENYSVNASSIGNSNSSNNIRTDNIGTDNTTDDNIIDVDNTEDLFSNISGNNATWVIKISGPKDLKFSGAYVDKLGPPMYINDTVPKDYTIISDSLAVKLQTLQKDENLTIEIMKDGIEVANNSTDKGLSITCNIKCYIS